LRTRVHAFKPEEFMQLALLGEEDAESTQDEATQSVRRTPLRVAAPLRRVLKIAAYWRRVAIVRK
jgi:hypothetical protein